MRGWQPHVLYPKSLLDIFSLEIITMIFIQLDSDMSAFSLTCCTFYTIANDRDNIASWFIVHYHHW